MGDGEIPPLVGIQLNGLRALVREVVVEVVNEIEARRMQEGERLAYDEPEAAALLGLTYGQLRDERQKHRRISASRISKGRVRYLKADLIRYLMRNRDEADE